MAVNDYRGHLVQPMNIYFAPSSATPTVSVTSIPGTLSSWSNVSQPSYYSGKQGSLRRFSLFFSRLAYRPKQVCHCVPSFFVAVPIKIEGKLGTPHR